MRICNPGFEFWTCCAIGIMWHRTHGSWLSLAGLIIIGMLINFVMFVKKEKDNG